MFFGLTALGFREALNICIAELMRDIDGKQVAEAGPTDAAQLFGKVGGGLDL